MYYRKNKYGESVAVEKYECDNCTNYEEMSGNVPEGGGCFLTTACCQYKGLPDDCEELQCLRAFRNNVLLKCVGGCLLVQEYYQIAPAIVEKIEAHEQREEILELIYQNIKMIEKSIREGKDSRAIDVFVQMVLRVQKIVEM